MSQWGQRPSLFAAQAHLWLLGDAVKAHAGTPMHVLVVEDEQRLGRLLRRALEANRHVVDVATDGETGLAAASGGGYDIIILDLGLPDLDGLEVCRRLRAGGIETP